MLGKEILIPEFTSCCCLSENARWPFFLARNDIFLSPKSKGITFSYHENLAKEYSSFSSYFNPKIVGDNRFSSEQIFTDTFSWVPLKCLKCSLITL